MTWAEFGLGVVIFVVTALETAIATWEGRADRQATSASDNRFSKKAAHWAAIFEAILVADIVITVSNPLLYAPVVVVAAWIGKYWAVERRRSKFRARTKPKKSPQEIAEIDEET